ncbi:amino acid ABC transporter permease [Candidatus Dependentiae bacterium]|nr:amino acid ABC transporter permease [Candidatus Dependentiae bacterium]
MMITNLLTTYANAAPLLAQGLCMTLQCWIAALCIALPLGALWGILRCNQLAQPIVCNALDVFTFMLRGIPFYVQLLVAYFVLPALFNIDIPASLAAAGSLGICSAAYVSQIVKAGINAIDPYQWEAAYVLGYSTSQTLRFIILPQAFKNVLPAIIGECDQLLKTTAVFSTIGILDLMGVGKNIVAQELNPLSIYSLIALLYLGLSSLLSFASAVVEKKEQA